MYVDPRIPVQSEPSLINSGTYKADKGLRRYAATVERALASWEVAPQEWADYISFLGRLLKVRSCDILENNWLCTTNDSRPFNLTLRMHQYCLRVVQLPPNLLNV